MMPFPRIRSGPQLGVDIVTAEESGMDGDLDLTSSDPVLHSGDVYIALDKPGRTRHFQAKRGRPLGGRECYHYRFANFNSDVDFLSKTSRSSWLPIMHLSFHDSQRAGEAGVVQNRAYALYRK